MGKINIAELLKDCPKGMELDCTMFDNVTFEGLNTADYPINIKVMGDDCYKYLTKTGCWNNNDNAKCVIFPKGKTTWEGFQRPFKDGDIVVTKTSNNFIFYSIYKCVENREVQAYVDYNLDMNKLMFNDNLSSLCFIDEIVEQRFATEEERQKLFDAIKANGYRWNAETKTLEKLITPKFKVGDRVKKKDSNEDDVLITDIADNYYIVETKYGMKVTISINIQNNYELVSNKFDMKKFEYLQVEYSKFPSPEELNKKGVDGWELIHIHIIKKRFFDSMLETYCVKEIYQATFKREVLSTSVEKTEKLKSENNYG